MTYVKIIAIAATVLAPAACATEADEKQMPQAGMTSSYFRSPDVERKVDSLISIMTLEEKIGQLVMYTSHFDVTGPSTPVETEGLIRRGGVGAVFNAFTAAHNMELQRLAVEESRLGIPLLFGYDIIHGFKTIFPINLGLAASWDTLLIQRTARVSAEEGSASGLQWTFSPMCDLTRDPRWGRVSEGSGEDGFLAGKIGAAMVRGYQGSDLKSPSSLLSCVKHFAGYGAPQAGRDYHTVDISDRTLRETYLPPYKTALDAGAATVMTAFNEIDGTPATASHYLFTDILRRDWGFRGFVVTDYTAVMELLHHGIARDSMQAAAKAVNAGVNMDMESGFYHKFLAGAVRRGEVESWHIDQMCREVLRIKYYAGLFDNPYKNMDTLREKTAYYKPEYMELSREAAAKSCVLLKNENSVLPLRENTKIAVIGPLADSRRDLLGSWKAAGDTTGMASLTDAMRERFGDSNILYAKGCSLMGSDRSGFARAIAQAKKADVIVVAAGESWEWTGEAASVTEITLMPVQQALIEALIATGKPVALVLFNGRPLELTDVAAHTDAILEAWFPGTDGARGVVDVLSGDYNPSGKLTMTFPRRVGQVPLHYDMKNTGRPYSDDKAGQKYLSRYLFTPNTPLFPFGYGLSYTTFRYSELKLARQHYKTGSTIGVTVKVTNTGLREGEETAQLYIRDMVGSVTRPVRQLRGFRKVNLKPGESRIIKFSLTPEDLSFYRADMSWGSEPGTYGVWVGGDSNATLGTSFELTDK